MSQDPAMIKSLVAKAGSNRTSLYHIREIERQIAAMSIGAGVGVAGVMPNREQSQRTQQQQGLRQ